MGCHAARLKTEVFTGCSYNQPGSDDENLNLVSGISGVGINYQK